MSSIAGIKAGNAFVVIGAIDDTGKVLAAIGRKLRRFGNAMDMMGRDLFFKSALALTPTAIGLKTFMDYDDAMRRVEGRTGATNDQMKILREEARTAGRAIGYTSREVANLMDELAQLGFNPADVMQMVKPVAALARAAGPGTDVDTRQSANVIGTTIHAFRMGADQAGHVADVFATAANKGNFALQDFVEAMSKVSPMAKTVGMSLEDTVALLAQLRNVGIEPEGAGVALRNIGLNASDTKQVDDFNEALIAAGKSAVKFTDEFGNFKNDDIAGLLFEIGAQIKDMGAATRINILDKLFGKRAAVPSIILSNAIDGFKEFRKELNNVDGNSEKVAGIMQSGLGGAWRRFLNGVEQVALSLGTVLEPTLIKLGSYLESTLKHIENWIKANPGWIMAITATTIGILALAAGLVVTGTAVKLLGVAFTTLSMVFGVFTIIKSLVVGAIVAITSAISVAMFTLQGIGAVISVFFALGPLVGILATVATAAVATAGAFSLWHNTIKPIIDTVTRLKDAVMGMFNEIIATGARVAHTIHEAFGPFQALLEAGKSEEAWKLAGAAIELVLVELKTTAMSIWREIADGAIEAFDRIKLKIGQTFATIAGVIPNKEEFFEIKKMMGEISFALGRELGTMDGVDLDKERLDADAHERKEARKAADQEGKDALKKAQLEYEKALTAARATVANLPPAGPIGTGTIPPPEIPRGNLPTLPPAADKLKPLDSLQKFTVEAAKAAYLARMQSAGDKDIQKQIANGVGQVAENTRTIAANLGVA